MTIFEKKQQLRKYKTIATGLLLLMAGIYIGTYFFCPDSVVNGYVRAFSEAAMVGALADWFAVTALFRHPLKLPIPHTNLIESNKEKIGQNLGSFVTENFLSPENIRPRLERWHFSKILSKWLQNPGNRKRITDEILRMVGEVLDKLDDAEMTAIIGKQAKNIFRKIPTAKLVGSALQGVLDNKFHEEWLNKLIKQAAYFIADNEVLIKEKVKGESHILIPDFVDDMIATKITKGLVNLLSEMYNDFDHPQRLQINQKLSQLAENMQTDSDWQKRFQDIGDQLLDSEKTPQYAENLWIYLKKYLSEKVHPENDRLYQYIDKTLQTLIKDYLNQPDKSRGIDRFVQVQAFKLIMRHKKDISRLISTTVNHWESKSLSQKLELEVGKDLQFIRFNGTLVGGLVGVLIHVFTEMFIH